MFQNFKTEFSVQKTKMHTYSIKVHQNILNENLLKNRTFFK